MNATISGYTVQFMNSNFAVWIEVTTGIRRIKVPVNVTLNSDNEYSVHLNGKN